jgi:hypothetical protein
MRVKRSDDGYRIEFAAGEAKAFFEELVDLPGGARRPKIRQVCDQLELAFKGVDERAGRAEELIARGKIIPMRRVEKEKP